MNSHFAFLLFLLVVILPATRILAQDSVPKLVNYQGRLTNASGQAMTDGTYKLQFSLYNKKDSSQAGDTLVWGSKYDVTVVSGQFNVVLGAAGGIQVAAAVNDIGFAFADSERYLQMTVLSDSTGTLLGTPQVLSPRQQLLSAPFALRAGDGNPPGTVIAFAGAALPPGYLICDGTEKNIVDYPALASALGTTHGAAASGKFKLPDALGRVLLGQGQGSALTARTLGQKPGGETAFLSTLNLPDHQHGINLTTSSSGAHAHTASEATVTIFGGSGSSSALCTQPVTTPINRTDLVTIASGGAHTHPVNGNSDPDSQSGNSMQASPFNVMNPALVVQHLIKY